MSPIAKLAAAGLAAALPAAALAHHGWSSYDESNPITLRGPLRDVVFANPHGTAKMIWRDREWNVVLAPVSRMNARGLSESEINRRQRVSLAGYVRRDGTPEMRVERITVGGETIELR